MDPFPEIELAFSPLAETGDALTASVAVGSAASHQAAFWIPVADVIPEAFPTLGWIKFERRAVIRHRVWFAATELRSASDGSTPAPLVRQEFSSRQQGGS